MPRSPPCPSAGGRSCGWSTSSNARPARGGRDRDSARARRAYVADAGGLRQTIWWPPRPTPTRRVSGGPSKHRSVSGAGRRSVTIPGRSPRRALRSVRCPRRRREMNSTIMLSIAGLLVPAAAAALRGAPSWLPAAGSGRASPAGSVRVRGAWGGPFSVPRRAWAWGSERPQRRSATVALTAPPRQVPVQPAVGPSHRRTSPILPVPSSVAPAPVPSGRRPPRRRRIRGSGVRRSARRRAHRRRGIGRPRSPSSVARVGPVGARSVPMRCVSDGPRRRVRRAPVAPRQRTAGQLGVPPGAGSVSVDRSGRSRRRRCDGGVGRRGRRFGGRRGHQDRSFSGLWSGIGPFELVATGNTVLSCPPPSTAARRRRCRGPNPNDLWNMVVPYRRRRPGFVDRVTLDVPGRGAGPFGLAHLGRRRPAASRSCSHGAERREGRHRSGHGLLTGPDGGIRSADVTGLVVGGPVTVGGSGPTGPGSWEGVVAGGGARAGGLPTATWARAPRMSICLVG